MNYSILKTLHKKRYTEQSAFTLLNLYRLYVLPLLKIFFITMRTLLFFISFLLIGSLYLTAQTTTFYTKDSITTLQNPERGFCEYTITFASSHSALDTSFLNNLRATKNHTIIFRYFNLDTFLNKPISADFLSKIQTDFTILRAAGFKVVVRFAYTNVYTATPPYLDAPVKPILLNHIAQLKPILLANADVILTLQNGFWGIWGENYYTDYYGYDGNNSTTTANWNDRKEIVDSLLKCIPASRKLSVRTPVKKAYYFNQTIPQDTLTAIQANNNSNIARVGAHNDCFLADYTDYTFDDTTIEKPFWRAESKYTIMGGETCNDNPIYTNCSNAKNELQNFHWTYCNDLYEPNVINRWKTNNCFSEIENKLGYRLRLKQATLSNLATAGGAFIYNIQLYNDGYAAPANNKAVKIMAKNTNNIDSFEMILPADIRNWFGQSTILLSGNINIPINAMSGTYKLYLKIQDTATTLMNDARYHIQLANIGLWTPALGANNLQQTVYVSDAPLSINAIDVQINCNAAENILTWQATNVEAINEFVIEQSANGYNYSNYTTIACKQNKINWQQELPKQAEALFYKLKTVYKNGNVKYSNAVRCLGNSNFNIISTASNEIEIHQVTTQKSTVQIFDMNGAIVFSKVFTTNVLHIATTNFASGLYIVKLSNENGTMQQKVIVP